MRSLPAMMITILVISFTGCQILFAILSPFVSMGFVIMIVFLWSGGFGWFIGKNYPTRPKRNVEPNPISPVQAALDNILEMINGL